MSNKFTLGETSALMRISAGMPYKFRKDRELTGKVQSEHNLGEKSGRWVKNKYPDWALEPIEKLVTEARAYHAAVTLPFDTGIGILPAALIMEYGEKMREFASKFKHLCETHFKPRYQEMIDWAKVEHNGTFNPADYPAIETVMESFYFRTEPLPVPDSGHFTSTIKSLLGVDTETVNFRVNDAMEEARKELMRRMILPVTHMAYTLAKKPCPCSNCKGKQSATGKFHDTLVENVRDIAALAPKLNISGDPAIDAFVKEMTKLTVMDADTLKESDNTRESTAADAMAVLEKMKGYKI